MKAKFAITSAAIFLAAVSLCVIVLYLRSVERQNDTRTIVVAGKLFDVDVADNTKERQQGLSGRTQLGNSEGMLFVFEESGLYSFWMKDMFFSIDIIWIDQNGRIVHIEENVSPSTYPASFLPEKPAKYVLEISAGSVKALKIEIEDIVRL